MLSKTQSKIHKDPNLVLCLYIRIQTLCFWLAPTCSKNGLSNPNVCFDRNEFESPLCILDCVLPNIHLDSNIYFKGRFLAKSAQAKNTRFKSECTNANQLWWLVCFGLCFSVYIWIPIFISKAIFWPSRRKSKTQGLNPNVQM
jgi:hypothetical protein